LSLDEHKRFPSQKTEKKCDVCHQAAKHLRAAQHVLDHPSKAGIKVVNLKNEVSGGHENLTIVTHE
jgi:hypothetical protein